MKPEQFLKLSEGNPGALSVLGKLLTYTDFNQMVLWIKKWGCTGPNLWILYKDICEEDIEQVVQFIRHHRHNSKQAEAMGFIQVFNDGNGRSLRLEEVKK